MNKLQIGGAVLLIVAAAIAYFTYVAEPTMQPQPSAENNEAGHMMDNVQITSDKDFINQMIPHHEEAVVMSQYIAANTTDAALQQFAGAVIDAQSAEIAQMKQWHTEWYNEAYQDNTSYAAMMSDLSSYQSPQLEIEYINGMIEHHLGAVDMAEQVLTVTTNDEIRQLAMAIIETQSAEIITLQEMLKTYEN